MCVCASVCVRASVRATQMPNSDLDNLIPILRSVTLTQQARLRLGMAKHYRAFLWYVQIVCMSLAVSHVLCVRVGVRLCVTVR